MIIYNLIAQWPYLAILSYFWMVYCSSCLAEDTPGVNFFRNLSEEVPFTVYYNQLMPTPLANHLRRIGTVRGFGGKSLWSDRLSARIRAAFSC